MTIFINYYLHYYIVLERKGSILKFSGSSYEFADFSMSNSFQMDCSSQELPSVFYFVDEKQSGRFSVPVGIFDSDMTPLQAAVKYAKEEGRLTNSQIAEVLGRKVRAVWLTYRAVKKKKFSRHAGYSLSIPLSIFNDSAFSALEALVYHLKSRSFSYSQIARLIGRDPRTVWTAYSRAGKKLDEAKNETE
jgi:DNA-binding CsgD family transcriptional regulator